MAGFELIAQASTGAALFASGLPVSAGPDDDDDDDDDDVGRSGNIDGDDEDDYDVDDDEDDEDDPLWAAWSRPPKRA